MPIPRKQIDSYEVIESGKDDDKLLVVQDLETKNVRLSTIFSYIKEKLSSLFDSKVDKIDGKQLSTNDYTNEDKSKVDSLEDRFNGYQVNNPH